MEKKELLDHHKQQELCKTRLPYRQGKKLTAVKTYTIASESKYLLVFGVPKINLRTELKNLCQKYGVVCFLSVCEDYAVEDFTECYKLKFERIQSARIAKRKLDTKNFYGGSLHVCYAPEYETVDDLREKLLQRRLDVLKRVKRNELDKKSLDIEQTYTTLSDVSCSINDNFHQSDTSLSSHLRNNGDSFYLVSGLSLSLNTLSSSNSLNNIPATNFQAQTINQFHNDSDTCQKDFNTKQNDNYKRKNVVEYVFKGKRFKKDKALKAKINKLEDVLNKEKSSAGVESQPTGSSSSNAISGRVVVCDSEIDKSRIFSAPKRSVNQVVIKLQNSSK